MKLEKMASFTIGMEVVGTLSLFLPVPLMRILPIFLFLHILATTNAFQWIISNTPKTAKKKNPISSIVIPIIAYFLPPVGPMIILMLADTLTRVEIREEMDLIQVLELPYYESEMLFKPTQFGEGGARSRLQNNAMSIELRISAMLALDTCQPQQKNFILRESLYDEDDEIRLLAFGLLNLQEKELLQEIHEAEDNLTTTTDETARALIYKELAVCHWELIYKELAVDDLHIYSIEHAKKYALKALEILPDDIGLWLLLSKLYLETKEFDQAKQALDKAQQLGATYSKVLPYLAELSYDKKDFPAVRALLASQPNLRDIPLFGPVYDFWCGKQ